MAAVMCINAGSTSLKFAVYHLGSELTLCCSGQVQDLLAHPTFEARGADGQALHPVGWTDPPPLDHAQALQQVLGWLQRQFPTLEITAAAHRMVHGGARFDAPVVLDEAVLDYLEGLCPLEPSHQPMNVGAARALMQAHPQWRQIACFDTAFHRHMPAVAQQYAVAPALQAAGLRHWGFHGISYEYLSQQLQQHWPQERRVVALHLGGGASACALLDGQSVDTSMGFGALSGLPMATRCGDVPVEGVLYLLHHQRFTLDALSDLLFKQSGLLGVSGLSSDLRVLEAHCASHAASRQAIDAFVYAVCKYVGAYAAVLGGLDALVFSAGIGEHSALVRAEVCQRLGWLGIELDDAANQHNAPCISAPSSRIAVRVIPTDEDGMMAVHARRLLMPDATPGQPRPAAASPPLAPPPSAAPQEAPHA